jgi:hypothetical protein
MGLERATLRDGAEETLGVIILGNFVIKYAEDNLVSGIGH